MSEYIYEHRPSGCDAFGNPVSLPTLVKREEIVRCMDCVWFANNPDYGAYCTNFGTSLHDDYDGFCAWSKRKEE